MKNVIDQLYDEVKNSKGIEQECYEKALKIVIRSRSGDYISRKNALDIIDTAMCHVYPEDYSDIINSLEKEIYRGITGLPSILPEGVDWDAAPNNFQDVPPEKR